MSQYNYSLYNSYLSCLKKQEYHKIKPLIDLNDIQNIYYPMGFKYFKIEEVFSNSKDNLFLFLLNYFIKDDKKQEVYEMAFNKGVLII